MLTKSVNCFQWYGEMFIFCYKYMQKHLLKKHYCFIKNLKKISFKLAKIKSHIKYITKQKEKIQFLQKLNMQQK